MKKYLLKLIKNAAYGSIGVIITTCGVLLANSNKAQENSIKSVKESFISVHLSNASLMQILSDIEAKTLYKFTYEKGDIDKKVKLDLQFEKVSVEEILLLLSKNASLQFKQVNNNIHVKKISSSLERLDKIEIIIQTRSITGKVTSQEDKGGLPGVNVIELGTTNGTVTDVQGNYSLQVSEEATLVFSSVGYISEEIIIGNRTVIDLVMVQDIRQLDELVVVGYGTQKKANVTGAISSVDFEDEAMSSRALTNVSTLLAGMSSGIRVQQINGLPSDNNEASIVIRGTGSLNASSAPLIIVDGQVADINSVSPNDVASVSILKDAASAAIYGSRASNGVILITTKTGMDSGGKITFNYNNFVGQKTPNVNQDLVDNSPDYMTLVNMMLFNSGMAQKFTEEYIEEWREGSKTDPIYYPNTNWWDAVVKDNTIMNHNFSARGGNEKINFFASFDYYDDDGLVPNSAYKKYNFRNNLTYQINEWLKFGSNVSVITTKSDPGTVARTFEWFRATTPAVVPKHPDGRYGSGQLLAGEGGTNNPVWNSEILRGENKTNQLQGKVFGVISPIKGLSITGSFFSDLAQRERWQGGVPTDQWNFQTNAVGIDRTSGSRLGLSNTYGRTQRQVYDLYADYVKSLGNHNFQVLGGYNQEYFFNRTLDASRSDLLTYDTPVLDAAASDPQAGGNASDFSIRSYFGRFSYNLKGKYLLETNLRYDGSSRFAPDKRWGLFPSVSAGWMISEEDFWSPLSKTINTLKLRASVGTLGNNGIGNYEWQEFYQAANYNFNDNIVQGLVYNSFGNPLITWESTNILNLGTDIRLFNTLTLDLNYYNKLTNNILANIPIPAVNGGIGAPRMNAAEVRNSGFEMEARYLFDVGKFSFNMGTNFSYNKNRIEKYKGDFIEPRANSQAWTEGQPIGIFWIREVDQIVQDQSIIDAMVADGFTFHPSAPGMGDFLYTNNNGDKIINDDDRVLKGNPIPLYTFGGNLGFAYQGFDLNMAFDGVGGWDRFLKNSLYSLNHQQGYQWPKEYMNAWTEQNPSNKIPKIYQNNEKNNQDSDYFLHSAAYLKIRSMQLGYSLPSSLIHAINISKLRVFVNLENYFVFTNWPDMDPEASVSGFDQTYPLSKTLSMGLSVSF